MNIGFEKQLSKGVVWNVDYLRNIGTHTLLGIDTNHVGDARFFNKTARHQCDFCYNGCSWLPWWRECCGY